MNRQILFIAALGFSVSSLNACTPTVRKRGNMVEDYQLEEIVQNVHTKTNVLKILGSPTTQAPFDPNLWYYIGQETEKRGIFDPKVKEERVIAVQFDDNDVVVAVNTIDNQRVDIPIDRDRTKTHGNKLTLPQQLLGNLGKFNNAGAAGGAATAGGGRPRTAGGGF